MTAGFLGTDIPRCASSVRVLIARLRRRFISGGADVDLAREAVLLAVPVLDGAKLQLRVRIADSVFELVVVSVRDVLGGGLRDLHELVPRVLRGVPVLEDSVDDLAGMMAAREEEKDLRCSVSR